MGGRTRVLADIQDGLDQADRFDRDTRHARGILAFAQLDHEARTGRRAGPGPSSTR
ncbi:Transcriptional regulator, TetR family (fragment) [Modestobacter italicus]|uniref:Transcriptional regulator, TetR family n=1 Tax=Modestobacter italicus (strain DSM 44449 / CECT 9708 / BC 501) TaxID=2732864 RepID=I4EYE5_MODI5